ncbi:uncharacterized protein LOC108739743 [Agrilus planipennis]|uniref:Uncharacterized protein LOC108739743 n=1 Tax=Agrilus planipennis TaxID=224129 RepID=A0A7F5RJE6_AGRPL|nr:uncharacterized protein LOC108739743 [Agrilus planipennis]
MAINRPLYSVCVAILGFVCFVIGATAVGLPVWGYFDDSPSDRTYGGPGSEQGYFGPWRKCKLLLYNRERCGEDASRFRTSWAVWISGVVACFGVAILGVYCFLSVLQLAMINSKEKVVMKYSALVMVKTALSLLAALLAIVAAALFALQVDNSENNGFQVTRGPAFYIQILLIILTALLFVASLYDTFFSRKEGGDPTKAVTVPTEATTYGNPGFRERAVSGGISMTDASGKPYPTNGSTVSMNTAMTSISSIGSNGSTVGSSVTRSPLRSSLKKPKPKDGLGIQNPGFSGSSPTFNRNGSVKKVRIQTHSTEV